MRKRVPPERRALDGRHNGGPLLADHVPEWGLRGVRAYFTWTAARRKAFHASPGTVRRRALKAKACGLTYEEYTSFLLDAGRYLQPTDTDEINAIKSRRER